MESIDRVAAAQAVEDRNDEEIRSFFASVLSDPSFRLDSLFAGQVSVRRQRNLISVVLYAIDRLKTLGLKPNAVPLRLIIPLFESASLEEDVDLQKNWANLLANVALAPEESRGSSLFICILKNMTRGQMEFLNALFETKLRKGATRKRVRQSDSLRSAISENELLKIGRDTSAVKTDDDPERVLEMLDVLRLMGIFIESTVLQPDKVEQSKLSRTGRFDVEFVGVQTAIECRLTELGISFIQSCRPPASDLRS